MDERPEPQRIEIELTTNAEIQDRTRHRPDQPPAQSDEVVVRSDEVDPTGWLGSDRGRLVVTATVVGLMALALGWSLGRVGESGDVATSSVTAPESTAPGTTVVLVGESLPPPQITTTIPKPRPSTTTSTLPDPVSTAIEVDPRLAGVDLTLIGIANGNRVVELDLAAQTRLERSLSLFGGDPSGLIVGDDWLLVGNPATGKSLVVHADGQSEPVDVGDPWQPLWIPGTDRFWRVSDDQPWDQPMTYVEVDLAGEPTGTTIELPAGSWPILVDHDGGLVVLTVGKNYVISESSVDLIGPGDLLALSGDFSVTRDCDAQLRCGLLVTDRRTGTTRTVQPDPSLGSSPMLQAVYGWGANRSSTLSPDGNMCVVIVPSNNTTRIGLIDLRTGDFVELSSSFYLPSVAWSPDGRFAFFLDEASLRAFDRETQDVFDVVDEPQMWTAFAQRPAGS